MNQPPRIPDRMLPGLLRYVRNGILPGSFLQAILRNDLEQAVAKADEENIHLLPAYVAWLADQAPVDCWGSASKVHNWVQLHELTRREASIPRSDVDDTPHLEDGRDNCNDGGTGEGRFHGRM